MESPSYFLYKTQFENAVDIMCRDVASAMAENGFVIQDDNAARQFMLMVTELAEACEADRHGNPPDKDLPHYSNVSVELADCVIRIMHFCGHHRIPLGKIIVEKCRFNEDRPPKHGKAY